MHMPWIALTGTAYADILTAKKKRTKAWLGWGAMLRWKKGMKKNSDYERDRAMRWRRLLA